MRKRLEQLIDEMLDGHILLPEAAAEFEKIYIEKALERSNNHICKAADTLGIHRNTITKKIAKPAPKPIKKRRTVKR